MTIKDLQDSQMWDLHSSRPTDIGPSTLQVLAATSLSGLRGEGAGAEAIPDCRIGVSETMYVPCIAGLPSPGVGAMLTAM
jgi:hypothetical protein